MRPRRGVRSPYVVMVSSVIAAAAVWSMNPVGGDAVGDLRRGERSVAPARAAAVSLTSAPEAREVPPRAIRLSRFCNGQDEEDDTGCLHRWMARASGRRDTVLYADPGRYHFNRPMDIASRTRLVCAGRRQTTFVRHGDYSGAITAGDYEAITRVHDISIESCGFDVNGDPNQFAWVLSSKPSRLSERVRIVGNRVFDSTFRGRRPVEQRVHISLHLCRDCTIANNRLFDGGRIQAGRPGQRIVIRNNRLHYANDNAITVVDGLGSVENPEFRGLSSDILIEGNVIRRALGSGVFFGVDGEGFQDDPGLATRRVTVRNNLIVGDQQHCVTGTLPSRAGKIRVVGNRCVKTGRWDPFATGISIRHGTNGTAVSIRVSRNRIRTSGDGRVASGIYLVGPIDRLAVTRNRTSGTDAAIVLRGGVTDGTVTRNRICAASGLRIDDRFTGTRGPNTIRRRPCD